MYIVREMVHKNDTALCARMNLPIKRTQQTNVHGTLAYPIIGLEYNLLVQESSCDGTQHTPLHFMH